MTAVCEHKKCKKKQSHAVRRWKGVSCFFLFFLQLQARNSESSWMKCRVKLGAGFTRIRAHVRQSWS